MEHLLQEVGKYLWNNPWVLGVALFLLMYTTWGMYIMCMMLIKVKKEGKMPFIALIFAYPWVIFGLIEDVLVNIFAGTLIFLEPPNVRRLLLTARLQYHLDDLIAMPANEKAKGLRAWRHAAALWICSNLLDPFDPKGFHCVNPEKLPQR
jgi:hypothetical protein